MCIDFTSLFWHTIQKDGQIFEIENKNRKEWLQEIFLSKMYTEILDGRKTKDYQNPIEINKVWVKIEGGFCEYNWKNWIFKSNGKMMKSITAYHLNN